MKMEYQVDGFIEYCVEKGLSRKTYANKENLSDCKFKVISNKWNAAHVYMCVALTMHTHTIIISVKRGDKYNGNCKCYY